MLTPPDEALLRLRRLLLARPPVANLHRARPARAARPETSLALKDSWLLRIWAVDLLRPDGARARRGPPRRRRVTVDLHAVVRRTRREAEAMLQSRR